MADETKPDETKLVDAAPPAPDATPTEPKRGKKATGDPKPTTTTADGVITATWE